MKKPRGNREVSRPPRGVLLLNVIARPFMGRGNDILFVYCHSERSEESPGRVAYRGVYIAVNCSNIKSVGFAFPGDVSLTLNMTRYSCLPYRGKHFFRFLLTL